MDASLARPAAPGRYPAVIVGMELFGVTGHIRSLVERFAEAGFVAVAPNFYHRTGAGLELAYDEAGRARGFDLLHALNRSDVLEDVAATLHVLRQREDTGPKIGFAGFSVGGMIAYLAAASLDLSAVAVFYAGWLTTSEGPLGGAEPALALTPAIADRGTALLFLVGEDDALIPADQRGEIARALEDTGVRPGMVVLPGVGHGFFCDERGSFDQEARDESWGRVLALFSSELS
ncbi:dienelactone hydrolase family protein [Rhodospirillum sp. A1_3_36]|uniref:dienelactone hydrolase family protein n=1 Tax=Rhodospirillum sp. A1_3_36 TaxID=3391666 RepID=UPI0039A4928C